MMSHIYPWKRKMNDIGLLADSEFVQMNKIQFEPNSFIGKDAHIDTRELILGSNSYIASHAMIRGNVSIGKDCSVNAYANIAGKISIGNGVRIATFVSIMGFNHGFADITTPIHSQPHTFKGITIEDDVWLGSNAVLVDGVKIGAHSIVAAGAIVTKSFPPYSVIGGNPAKIIKMRYNVSEQTKMRLESFAKSYSNEWQEIIHNNRKQVNQQWLYYEGQSENVTKRALCDAIEIAASFDSVPPDEDKNQLIKKLNAMQDPISGLCVSKKEVQNDIAEYLKVGYYPSMSCFYALQCLGQKPKLPIHFVEACSAEQFIEKFEKLPWATNAWYCGSQVDELLTMFYFYNQSTSQPLDTQYFFEWLDKMVKPHTGLWGDDTREKGWLLPVNGFYRLTRGSYAQFHKKIPYPKQAIDTIFMHILQYQFLEAKNFTACNILDVVHPLWLCAKYTDHRKNEIRDFQEKIINLILNHYINKQGFGFSPDVRPTLQGTEMWAAILYIACDYLGMQNLLPYKPKGVHILGF